MKLSSSPKVYENFKCDYPENTIKRIKKGFHKLGLTINYKESTIASPDFSLYASHALIDILGWGQNGKGISSLLAQASAYAELTERFSSGYMQIAIPLPIKSAKYHHLLENVNERRYVKGFELNPDHESTSFDNIKKYFQRELSQKEYKLYKNKHWFDNLVDAYSLTRQTYVKVPIICIELNSMSNGLASGNTYEEAIAQASFEVFERYAINKIVAEKKNCPTIALDTIPNNDIQRSIKLFNSLNIEVITKDFTLNNSIPVIGVLFIDHNLKDDPNKLKKERYYKRINAGSHQNLYEAIMRCFTEYLQMIGTDKKDLLNRKKSDILYDAWTNIIGKRYHGVDNEFKYFARHYDYYGDLSFLEQGETISFTDLTSTINRDSLDDVGNIINICNSNNWELLVVDYTHKILQFPTVRVIIPGVSIDFDHFIRYIFTKRNLEEQVNAFYSIRDFYKYLKTKDWINDPNRIKTLINNLEKYLSKELMYHNILISRENNFSQIINLFHVLPFLYLSIGQYNIAKKYFKALMQIDFCPYIESSYFKSLYLLKHNPTVYNTYIDLLDKCEKNNNSYSFKLNSNPFDPNRCEGHLDNMYCSLLKRINDSFI